MSNNIKKGLVMLGLAVVCVSGLAANNPPPTEPASPPEQHCSTPGCTSMQSDHGANSQTSNGETGNWQKLKHRKDYPNGPIIPSH